MLLVHFILNQILVSEMGMEYGHLTVHVRPERYKISPGIANSDMRTVLDTQYQHFDMSMAEFESHSL